MPERLTVIDVETKNIGYDIMADNTKLLSVQLNDGTTAELYYADAKTANLAYAGRRIRDMISDGYQFVGYNINNFDLVMLKKFLDIEIPRSQVVDIGDLENMLLLKKQLNRKGISLEDACGHFGVNCTHKGLLKPLSDRIRTLPEVIQKAKIGGMKLAAAKGWSAGFSQEYALAKISGGMAILDCYNEFVKLDGASDSVFYRYAMGDVISEYSLYRKLRPT